MQLVLLGRRSPDRTPRRGAPNRCHRRGTYAEAPEGFVNPCIVDGADVGHNLYDLGMIGWFGIVTIPFGALALIVLIVVWIVISAVNRPRTKGRVA